MKTINFTNQPDHEALAAAGIILTCNEDMDYTISDEDYKKMEDLFPAAFNDSFLANEEEEEPTMTVEDVAAEEGLDTVDTTSERNGYPSNIRRAVVGFDNFESAKEIAGKYGLSLIWIDKKEGWNIWHRGEDAYKPMEIRPEYFGSDYNFENEVDSYKETALDNIKYMLDNDADFDDIERAVTNAEKVIDAICKLEADEVVVTVNDEYYDTIELHPIYFSNDGKHTQLAAIRY